MTSMRRQLDSARRHYQAARYGGDLASELLPVPRRIVDIRMLASGMIGAAAAALVIFAVGGPQISSQSDQTPLVINIPQPATTQPSLQQTAAIDFTIVPPAMDLSVPSWDAIREQASKSTSSSSTQEITSSTEEPV